MEEKMDVPEDSHDTEMLDCTARESVVSNPALQHPIGEEESPSKQEPGDRIGVASAATTESGGVEAPPAITQPDEVMEVVVVAPSAITAPDKVMEDVMLSPNKLPDDGLEDHGPQATLEHAADLQETIAAGSLEDVALSADGESVDNTEVMPPSITDPNLGKEVAPVVASPSDGLERPSIIPADAETGMEDQLDNIIGDNPGDAEVSSILATKLDVAASDDGDSEALLVESRVNLSRIPNSPESTH